MALSSIALIVLSPALSAQDTEPLEENTAIIDREPFDRLHFDNFNGNRVLDIHPIEFDGVTANTPIDPNTMQGRLVFTMPEHPDRVFSVPWSNLVKVERYSEMVLDESRKAMEAKDYATAFKTLIFLKENTQTGDTAELRQLMDQCLYGDGQFNLEQGNYSEALAAFEELFRRNRRFRAGEDTVLDKITFCIDLFVEQQIKNSEFEKAREILRYIEQEYGSQMSTIVEAWNEDMKQRSLSELERLRTLLDQDDGDAIHKSVRKLLYMNPDLPQAKATSDLVMNRFPYIYVGVAQPANDKDARRIDNWAARRVGRLTSRYLMEYDGPGDEGGRYIFPSGRFQRVDDLGVEYRFRLNPTEQFGVPALTTYEIAKRLGELADPKSPDYYIPWERLVTTIEIEDEKSVLFKLRHPHVRPEALFPIPYFAKSDKRGAEDNGVYEQIASNGNENVFEVNSAYTRPQGLQFPRIIERQYKNTSEATDALIRGELDVVDRVFPADVHRLRKNPMIDVKPYIVPTMHLLIPNPRNEFMKSDHFRRALHSGINRELIVQQLITGGTDMDGFQIVSGPFPPGTDAADQFAYAYNFGVEPRQFNVQLAMVLTQQFLSEERIRREKAEEENPHVELPTIVLAHPDTDLITAICQTIAQQWRLAGIDTQLRVLPVGVTKPDDDDYDLLFCEIQIQEPLVDANSLFGRGGLVQMVDPTIELALRQLDASYTWAEVSRSLRRIHEQSSNNLTVLPLWQIVEHFAYRNNVFNIGDQLIYLYQNVDRWRITGNQAQVSQK